LTVPLDRALEILAAAERVTTPDGLALVCWSLTPREMAELLLVLRRHQEATDELLAVVAEVQKGVTWSRVPGSLSDRLRQAADRLEGWE
jgi:hypothetical protein